MIFRLEEIFDLKSRFKEKNIKYVYLNRKSCIRKFSETMAVQK